MAQTLQKLLSPLNTLKQRLSPSRSTESSILSQNNEVSDLTLANIGAITSPENSDSDSDSFLRQEKHSSNNSPNEAASKPAKKKRRTKKGKQSGANLHCVEGCKFNRKDSAEMLQCYLCQVWSHYECIGEKQADIIGIWSCKACRIIPRNIDRMLCKMASLERTIQQVQNNTDQLVKIVQDQTKTATDLKNENAALRIQIASLEQQITQCDQLSPQCDRISAELLVIKELLEKSNSRPFETEPQAHDRDSTLLLTNDLLGGVTKVKSKDGKPVQIKRFHGSNFDNIAGELNNNPSQRFGKVVIACNPASGVGQTETPASEIHKDFMNLVKAAVPTADVIAVSSMLPSLDDAKDRTRKAINESIKPICGDMNIQYVDNDMNFRFCNGTCDVTAYEPDREHLSRTGIARLLDNLSLTAENTRPPPSNRNILAQPEERTTYRGPRTRNLPNKHQDSYRHVPGQCATCGEENHVTGRCRHRTKVQCHKCGQYGHKSKHHQGRVVSAR